jgi:hypothetical protein
MDGDMYIYVTRSDLLGNAVVVSICLWFGLSSLYR